MRIALIGAAASVALVSASAIAVAQMPGGAEPPGKMQSPGAQAPGAGKGDAQRAPDAGQGKGMKESQGAPGKDQPKATESQHEKSQPKASQGQPEKSQPKASEGRPEKSQPKATQGQPEKAQPKASEGQPEKAQPKASQGQPEKGQPKASQGQPDKGQKSTQGQQQGTQQAARVQVTEQQRSGVRERLFKDGKFERTKLNIRVNVGTRVPRSVRLLPMPVFIVDLAPAYRDYNYIVAEDETIYIVDPRSYEVVDVIETGTQRADRPQGPRLSLSQEQMRFISGNVPRERRADVRVRLALGAEVPRDVELLAFPREVVSQMPDLDGYRYIVAENDIVIVDPRERGVVLVITD
jgi:Protein of unknown function (DUF1236)